MTFYHIVYNTLYHSTCTTHKNTSQTLWKGLNIYICQSLMNDMNRTDMLWQPRMQHFYVFTPAVEGLGRTDYNW